MDPLPNGDWVLLEALPNDVDPWGAGTSCEKLHRLPLLHLPCKKKVHNLLPLLSVAGRSVFLLLLLLLLLLLEAPKLVLLLLLLLMLLLLLFQGDGTAPALVIVGPVGAACRNGEVEVVGLLLVLLLLSCCCDDDAGAAP